MSLLFTSSIMVDSTCPPCWDSAAVLNERLVYQLAPLRDGQEQSTRHRRRDNLESKTRYWVLQVGRQSRDRPTRGVAELRHPTVQRSPGRSRSVNEVSVDRPRSGIGARQSLLATRQ